MSSHSHAHASDHGLGHDHDDDHDRTHDHGHGAHDHGGFGHSHAPTSFGRAFVIAIVLNAAMVVAEVVAGLVGGSVALVSDAAHNLSDVLGLVSAYAAMRLGSRAPSTRFTYGLGGSSILAALFNAVTLLLVTGALIVEAVQRLLAPEPVATGLVMATAGAAILVNAASAWLLAPRGTGDLNVRAAAAHLAADAAVAAGVVIGAFVIQLTGWRWVDPALSLAINAIIVVATWNLLRESVALSLAGVPRSVEREAVRLYLAGLPGVEGLHDLHIWPLSTSETAMTVHLVMPSGHPGDVFLMEACHTLRERHRIGHATLQVETSLETTCRLASHAA